MVWLRGSSLTQRLARHPRQRIYAVAGVTLPITHKSNIISFSTGGN